MPPRGTAKHVDPLIMPPSPASPAPQLEIAHKTRYHGGGSAANGSAGGAGSLPRPQSPRVIGAVTLAEAKARLGPGFSILGERPVVARAVAAPEQALSALRECNKEADRGVGDAFHLQR